MGDAEFLVCSVRAEHSNDRVSTGISELFPLFLSNAAVKGAEYSCFNDDADPAQCMWYPSPSAKLPDLTVSHSSFKMSSRRRIDGYQTHYQKSVNTKKIINRGQKLEYKR